MIDEISASTRVIHKFYESFLNSYKTFVVVPFCSHSADSELKG